MLAGRVVIGSSSGSKTASADTGSATVDSTPAAEGNQTKTATNPNKPSSSERKAVTGEANQKKRDRKDGSTKDKQSGPVLRLR